MPDRFADGETSNNFPDSGTYDRGNPHAYHGGDLKGIEQRLPYLKDLGITALWITPVYNNNDRTGQDYHGYGAVDLYAVEEHLGTLEEYRSLVRSAHSLGLKVLLDVVPNHLGPAHPWVDDPPSEHWLHGTRARHLIASDQFQHLADPHASPRDWRAVVEGWFVDALPDMGTDDPLAAQYLRQNALWWAETGVLDGFRIDTFPYVDRPFWRDFHRDLHSAYPRFRTVGEVSGYDPAVTAFFAGGRVNAGIDTGVDTVFDFTLYAALRKVILRDAPATLLEEVLQRDWLFPHPEMLVTFLGNHDVPRFMGEPGASVQKLKMAFTLLLTTRGVPQLYAGDEIAMPGGDDPDNRRDFPGGFPGDRRNAFTAEGRTPEEQQVFAYLHDLLRLRKQHPALRRGAQTHIFSDERAMVYLREFAGSAEPAERLLMIMNNSDQERMITFSIADTPLARAKGLMKVLAERDAMIADGRIEVRTPGRSVSIYRVE
jgi:glycosidase